MFKQKKSIFIHAIDKTLIFEYEVAFLENAHYFKKILPMEVNSFLCCVLFFYYNNVMSFFILKKPLIESNFQGNINIYTCSYAKELPFKRITKKEKEEIKSKLTNIKLIKTFYEAKNQLILEAKDIIVYEENKFLYEYYSIFLTKKHKELTEKTNPFLRKLKQKEWWWKN